MPRRTHRPALPEWQRSRPFQSQQDQIQFLAQPGPAAPGNQNPQLPRHILARVQPFLSAQSRLRPSLAVAATADIAALDSNVQAVGQLKIQRRTDITYIRVRHKKPPDELDAPEVVAATAAQRDQLIQLRNLRLESLWLSGAITDDEYFALRFAA